MKTSLKTLFLLLLISVSLAFATPQQVNYQGYLTRPSGTPLDTTVAMTFKLYTDSLAGSLLWTESRPNIAVASGLFNVRLGSLVPLNGSVFDSPPVWLGTTVGNNTEMQPRIRLASVNHSLRVDALNGASGGTVTGDVNVVGRSNFGWNNVLGDSAFVIGVRDSATGPFSTVLGGKNNAALDSFCVVAGGYGNKAGGDTAGVLLLSGSGSCSFIGGGSGNDASGHYSSICGGSLNEASGEYSSVSGGLYNTAWELAFTGGGAVNVASGSRSVVVGGSYNNASGYYAVVSGGYYNNVTGDTSTVGGGALNEATGLTSTIGGGSRNHATDSYSTVGGGVGNTAVRWATVGGGSSNVAEGIYSTVGGGYGNITGNDNATTIAGGTNNLCASPYGSIGGGTGNSLTASGSCTIAGGNSNQISGVRGAIGGGYTNSVTDSGGTVSGGSNNLASGKYSAIGGGYGNSANGIWATVGGGTTNIASGLYSTVPGGSGCAARGDHSFAAGRNARANHIGSFVWSNFLPFDSTVSFGINSFTVRCSGGARFYTGLTDTTTGVRLPPGGGAWASLSDSTTKRRLGRVDTKDVLQKVCELPIERWSYKTQDEKIQHIGPMAQDFYNAFKVGDDNKTITTVDPDGISLAAIQELAKRNEKLEIRNENQDEEIKELRAMVQSLIADKKLTLNTK